MLDVMLRPVKSTGIAKKVSEFGSSCNFVRRRHVANVVCYPHWLKSPRLKRTAERLMSRFYFDFHDAGGILSDDAGEELPSVNIARNIALETVGQAQGLHV